MNLLKTALTILVLAVPLASFAQPRHTQPLNQRQASLERRIDQGVRSGSLTRHEAARLYRGQRQLNSMVYRARADGRVSPRERAGLERAMERQSRRIFRQKHDAQYSVRHRSWGTHQYYVHR